MYYLLNLSHWFKCYGHFFFVKLWLFLSCPLTRYGHVANFENSFHFVPILLLILTKILVEKPFTSEVVSRKSQLVESSEVIWTAHCQVFPL